MRSRFGSFLTMGLIGIVLASVVNIFVGWSALQFAISVIGVLVFTGLTAFDTQRIKESYLDSDAHDIATILQTGATPDMACVQRTTAIATIGSETFPPDFFHP